MYIFGTYCSTIIIVHTRQYMHQTVICSMKLVQHKKLFLSLFCRQLEVGMFSVVANGTGLQCRNVLYIATVKSGHLLALQARQVFNTQRECTRGNYSTVVLCI